MLRICGFGIDATTKELTNKETLISLNTLSINQHQAETKTMGKLRTYKGTRTEEQTR